MLDDLSIVRTKQSITEILRQKFFLKISVSNRKKINKYMNEQIEKKDFTIISSF